MIGLRIWTLPRVCGLLLGSAVAMAWPAVAAGPGTPRPAPELVGGGPWINSPPLQLSSLRGKVVLVEFWTYTCANCLRVAPYVVHWQQHYAGQGLVVIGVHTPEFAYERLTANVREATVRLGITYPVVQDNQYRIWNAWGNRFWPVLYLVDRQGRIVYQHIGEGDYATTEARIAALLATP